MLNLAQVSFAYGDRKAISGVTLSVAEGEFLGVLGPNSAGKSTLLRLMSRELQPGSGSVQLDGRLLSQWKLDELARVVTVVSADEHFTFPFTVHQIVSMGRLPYIPRGRTESVHDQALVGEAMQATDVWELRDRVIHQLSSGERQRVLLARALAQEPKVLILDEPTIHLDIGHAWALFELLSRLHREKNLTIISSLHDLMLAQSFCSRLLLMRQGEIYAQGRSADVLSESYVREVFGISLPNLSSSIQERTFREKISPTHSIL